MDVKIAQANTDKFLLPKPVGPWKKPYRPRSSLLSTASLVKAQMAQTTGPATLALALAKVISAPSLCQFCQRNHNRESARDLDKSSKQKPFKCQFCKEIFQISCLFIAHMENHTGKSLYRCEFCGILFVDFFSMIAHRKDHLAFPCKQCNQKFSSTEELAKHMTSVHLQRKKVPRMSKLSKKAFSLKVDMILEQNTNVLKPIHTCGVCYKSFPLLSHLLTHKKCHTKEKPYKCDVCGKNFKHSTVLKIHQQQHTGAEVYVCEHCGRVFSQCRHLASHIRTHGKDMMSGPIPKESGKSSPLLLSALMHNSPPPGKLQPGQIVNASGTIENTIPAHSNGKVPLKITNTSPASPMDAPLDFRQQAPVGAVRRSVIRQVSADSSVCNEQELQRNVGNSGKNSSVINQVPITQVASTAVTYVNSPTSVINSSSIAPVVSSSAAAALLPATVSTVITPVPLNRVISPTSTMSMTSPVPLNRVISPTSTMPMTSPVSLSPKISSETITTQVSTTVVNSEVTKTVEIKRPASAEALPVSSRIKVPAVRSSSIDQATAKRLQHTPRLPLKLQLKEEPGKWLTNHVQTASTFTSPTPSPTITLEPKRLKIEKMDTDTFISPTLSPSITTEPKRIKIEKMDTDTYISPTPSPSITTEPRRLKIGQMDTDPEVLINYVKSDTKDRSEFKQMSPIALVKSEPMEISSEVKSRDLAEPVTNFNEVPHLEAVTQSHKLKIFESSELNCQGVNNSKYMDPDKISRMGSKVNEEKNRFKMNEKVEAPLSLVKRESIPNSVSNLPLKAAIKKERSMSNANKMPQDQVSSSDICKYCGKTHNKELMNFLEGNPGDKPYKCHFCGNMFSMGCLFSKHIESHTGQILYQCDVCHRIFDDFLSLIFHRKTVHQGYVCSQCNQVFVCDSDLKRHMRLGHYVEKTYNCEFCGKIFLQKCNLTFHRHTHTGEQPYSCEECGRKFARPGSLNAHMRTHSRLKPHKCDMCDKAFSTSGRLRCHTRLHVREMTFKCDLCEKSFPQSKGLREHVRLWHNDEKLPYECEECGKRYMYSYMLIQHRLSHRGKNILREVVTDTLTTHKKTE